jgi:CheY-like chemotaxis protein
LATRGQARKRSTRSKLSALDLVLIDVMMPGMGGAAAANDILHRRRDVAIVLISVDDQALGDGFSAFGNAVAYARKQDLCPAQLKHFWESRGKS